MNISFECNLKNIAFARAISNLSSLFRVGPSIDSVLKWRCVMPDSNVAGPICIWHRLGKPITTNQWTPFHRHHSVSSISFSLLNIYLDQRAFDPLPAGLLKEHLNPARRFETTSGSFHNKKASIPELRNPIYQKAPSSRRIQYMSNTSDARQSHNNHF